jgi:ABC-type Fe3+/spermidine/putrescine transport system ATPase subunit
MLDGSIVQAGTAEEVYYHPADAWAATFGGAGNLVPGLVDDGLVETLVGRFRVGNGGKDGRGPVHALIRPELLELRPDPQGAAQVVAREFRGHDVFYRLRLGDGTTLVSQRPSTELVPLGARVAVRPHEAEVAVFS